MLKGVGSSFTVVRWLSTRIKVRPRECVRPFSGKVSPGGPCYFRATSGRFSLRHCFTICLLEEGQDIGTTMIHTRISPFTANHGGQHVCNHLLIRRSENGFPA